MEWSETISLWNQTQVKILDIRHVVMNSGEELQHYHLPANAFFCANQGEARLMINGVEATFSYSQVLHGGKGAYLNIQCLNRQFDYYLILYKPICSSADQGISRKDAFGRQYIFQAKHPLLLLTVLERMYQQFTNGEALERLLVTGLFYQFVHEQFRQLQLVGTEASTPDLAVQMALYIQEQYRKMISMETLANLFHYSTHYLSRVFKRKYGCSPIEYLIQTRMNRAKYLLSETDAPIRDIADNVGYTDMYYFSRLFKKQTGATPAQFKMHNLGLKGSIRTNFMPESFIAPQAAESYILNSDNHYQHDAWRVNEMNISFKPSFAVTFLFSLSLLLAACGGGAGTDLQQSAKGNNLQQNETVNALPAETRMYKDDLGRQIEIPVHPSKVAVVTYGGYLLPLGLKPVGADQETIKQYPNDMSDVQSIGEGLGNVEAISALEPDLIILPDYYKAENYATYEKIAPTIAVAWGGDPDVVNTLRTIGDVMNRKQEAEAWIAKFEEKLQRIREKMDTNIKSGTTAMTFILYKGEVLLGGEGGTLGKLIYKDYGFQMPEQLKKYSDGGGVLSMEELVSQPADYFFTQMTDEEMEQMTKLFKEPVYQTIPAVKNNRIINVSRNKWNYGPYLVDEAVDTLIEKVSLSQK